MQVRFLWFALLAPALAQADGSRPGFNPDLSLILAGQYAGLGNDPDAYSIPGFMSGPETGPGPRGLSLGESELILGANIDDLFHGQFTAALTPEGEVEVEEAYVQTLGLAGGVTLRAGRFLSGIGTLNSQHPHRWDFADTALPYRALLANRYGDDGVRISWVAPTDLFFELGGEWLRGENFPAGGAAREGRGTVTAFVRRQPGGDRGPGVEVVAAGQPPATELHVPGGSPVARGGRAVYRRPEQHQRPGGE